ncbi:hypothetical protein D9M68_920050 [compost metagenome]
MGPKAKDPLYDGLPLPCGTLEQDVTNQGQGHPARTGATQGPPQTWASVPVARRRTTRQARPRIPTLQGRDLCAWVFLAPAH